MEDETSETWRLVFLILKKNKEKKENEQDKKNKKEPLPHQRRMEVDIRDPTEAKNGVSEDRSIRAR